MTVEAPTTVVEPSADIPPFSSKSARLIDHFLGYQQVSADRESDQECFRIDGWDQEQAKDYPSGLWQVCGIVGTHAADDHAIVRITEGPLEGLLAVLPKPFLAWGDEGNWQPGQTGYAAILDCRKLEGNAKGHGLIASRRHSIFLRLLFRRFYHREVRACIVGGSAVVLIPRRDHISELLDNGAAIRDNLTKSTAVNDLHIWRLPGGGGPIKRVECALTLVTNAENEAFKLSECNVFGTPMIRIDALPEVLLGIAENHAQRLQLVAEIAGYPVTVTLVKETMPIEEVLTFSPVRGKTPSRLTPLPEGQDVPPEPKPCQTLLATRMAAYYSNAANPQTLSAHFKTALESNDSKSTIPEEAFHLDVFRAADEHQESYPLHLCQIRGEARAGNHAIVRITDGPLKGRRAFLPDDFLAWGDNRRWKQGDIGFAIAVECSTTGVGGATGERHLVVSRKHSAFIRMLVAHFFKMEVRALAYGRAGAILVPDSLSVAQLIGPQAAHVRKLADLAGMRYLKICQVPQDLPNEIATVAFAIRSVTGLHGSKFRLRKLSLNGEPAVLIGVPRGSVHGIDDEPSLEIISEVAGMKVLKCDEKDLWAYVAS